MADDKGRGRPAGFFHKDELDKIPTPLGFCHTMMIEGENYRVVAEGAIEVYICPNCDKIHMNFEIPGLIKTSLALETKIAELITRMLNDPQPLKFEE
jgi:hypothetical protein